jgi:serine protease AprX
MRGVLWHGTSRRVATVGTVSLLCFGASIAAPAVAQAGGSKSSGPKTQVVGTTWGDRGADQAGKDSSGKNSPSLDPGSLFTLSYAVRARDAWNMKDGAGQAVTGKGVTVALVDSGVEAVPGLDAPGKIIRGPDLSLETNSDGLAGHDTFGHGTHLAGIIAARDVVPIDGKTGAPKTDDVSKQLGIAPDAKLLALKLATTDGSTDVSQVIAALDWVAQHKNDNGMNVRVVNLSYGTGSLQPYQVDPLAAAAEHAWKRGLVVVVSGGNGGATAGSLTDPAIDPYVIAVGASDPRGTARGWVSPVVADFSSVGTSARHVDLVAPGRSVASLRDPGSFVDVNHPEGLVAGDTTSRLFRGSGTSQAAAVVSGAAALVLQANPRLTPDQVKSVLLKTARPISGASAVQAGAGELDAAAAVSSAMSTKAGSVPVVQTWASATGLGSLDAARGDSHLEDLDSGAILAGEVDVLGSPWNPALWSASSAAGTTWAGGQWNGARWTGDTWTAIGWARARWADGGWARARWADASWDTARWARARWADALWDRARWASTTLS